MNNKQIKMKLWIVAALGITSLASATLSFTGLGNLPDGFLQSAARGLSADGSVVVGYAGSANGRQAFRWTSNGMAGLGDLVGGSFESRARSVSADGSVVVGFSVSSNGNEAFRWTSSGMVGLGDLVGGSFDSLASDVSADGSVVVGRGQSANGTEAFRWTSSGMVGLGDLAGGNFSSIANGTSADGSVIVGIGRTANGQEAFVWDEVEGMQSLKTVLEDGGLDLTGWTLTSAEGVSDDGKTIVGYGTHNGNTEAFVAVIPEPNVIALVGIFGSGFLFIRRFFPSV